MAKQATQKSKRFYECGCCGHWHNDAWHGDCRQDDARFTIEEIEQSHGEYGVGWVEVSMDGNEPLLPRWNGEDARGRD